jgi:hypothetical protein
MNTNEMTQVERETVLMVNAYGVNVAVKQAQTMIKTYAFNNNECVYWMEVYNKLVVMRNQTMHNTR